MLFVFFLFVCFDAADFERHERGFASDAGDQRIASCPSTVIKFHQFNSTHTHNQPSPGLCFCLLFGITCLFAFGFVLHAGTLGKAFIFGPRFVAAAVDWMYWSPFLSYGAERWRERECVCV